MLYTVTDILSQHQRRSDPTKVAIVDGSQRVTYAELIERSLRQAALLKKAGLSRGARVGIYLRRSVEAVVALFGTYFAGGVAVIINEQLRARQVRYILEHSEASLLLADNHQLFYTAERVMDEGRIINVDRSDTVEPLPTPERTIAADLALIIYTSGSTGLPKGVMLQHSHLLSGAQIVADYLELSDDDIIISLLPFSFDYGLNQLLTAFLMGGTLVVQRSLFPPDICRTLQRERVTGMAGVPTLWQQLVQDRSPFAKSSFPALRYITNSGGRLPESIVRLVRQTHPHVAIYLMYGLTEAFRSTYLPPSDVDSHPGSIGKAMPNTEILVVNEEGHVCKPGEVGELVHRGATVAAGYWRDPDASARVFRPHPFETTRPDRPETVVYSGDLVTTDADGYLYYVGRRDQLIKSSGFRVSPEEIETAIFSSGLVTHVAAFAIPRSEFEDAIVAAVVARQPGEFQEASLRQFCKDVMPEYMHPRVIWRLDRLALTSSGKPDRPKLKAAYLETHRTSSTVARAAGTA